MNQLVHSRPVRAGPSTLKGGLASSPPPAVAASRTNDPQRTMAGILEVALREFADKGLSGARIDAIAAATSTSKRMIYYYFGSKEGLYLAVLEESYRQMRRIEGELTLDNLPPEEALRRLVEFTFDHHVTHEDYIRIVMNENIERGKFLAQSKIIQKLNVPAISAIERIYVRGVASGVFRPGLDAIDLHASISALAFFNVSNQYSFGQIFKRDMAASAVRAMRRASIVEMVVRFMKA
jgi:AcrR family transcriptional regulator